MRHHISKIELARLRLCNFSGYRRDKNYRCLSFIEQI